MIKVSERPASRKNTSGMSPSERMRVSVPMVEGPKWTIVSSPFTIRKSTFPKIVPNIIALLKTAPPRVALLRSAPMRVAPLRSAPMRVAPLK